MLIDKLKKETLQARKEKNEIKANLLSTIFSQVKLAAIDDKHREPNDQDVVNIVKKFLKSVEENIALGERGEIPRQSYEQSLKEKEILLEYLPGQLSEEDIRKIIKESGAKNVGEAMRFLKEKYPDQYDGKIASQIAKEILGK